MNVSGFICLLSLLRHHGFDVVPEQLLDNAPPPDDAVISEADFVRLAHKAGLRARMVQMPFTRFAAIERSLPAILKLTDGRFVVLIALKVTEKGVMLGVHDPVVGGAVERWDEEKSAGLATEKIVLLRRQWAISDTARPFGLLWFVAEALRDRRIFMQICLAAVLLHLLALATPFFTQIVVDKVLAYHVTATLTVLTVGVVIAILFEVFLGWVRGVLTVHASAKLDVRVARRIFAQLVALPITFFEHIPAGVLAKHVDQSERVRSFLVERLLGSLLDALALIVYLPLLFFYSPLLAGIVLAFSCAIAIIVAAVSPYYRGRLETLYKAEAERQSLLVETVHGMATIKALSLETPRRSAWDRLAAQAASRTMSVGRLSLGARSLWQALEKLLPVTVVVFGVQQVISGQMSVGALIAFQMISGRVVSPLTQLAALINEFQQARLSVSMLAGIMLTPPEQTAQRALRPAKFDGEIVFDDVSFTYPGATRPALDRISFSIPAGALIGIVGQSGSGKTTLTRILQGFHVAQGGQVFIDGIDARELDRSHWRQRIGVVPQHSFLFRGTVRANIGLSRTGATFEEIVDAAKLAGAHDFIKKLPEGYDTQIEEGAVNLSGGQGQRISIARALLRLPQVLIFDEATSALDPESERVVQAGMSKIAPGRTVIIVSHRLQSIRSADKILVLDEGRVVGFAAHDELMHTCPLYRQLAGTQHAPTTVEGADDVSAY